MTDTKHTPGPWRMIDFEPGIWIEFPVGHLTSRIAVVDDGAGINDPLANARLISAAPDLLEALEQLVSDYERGIHVEFGGSPWLKEKLEELNYARAAIAKALGETK